MNQRLQKLFARVGSLFGRKGQGDRPRLMGIYLDGANRPSGAAVREAGNRERQDGKFAQIRRRSSG